jgi:hypothetical protein
MQLRSRVGDARCNKYCEGHSIHLPSPVNIKFDSAEGTLVTFTHTAPAKIVRINLTIITGLRECNKVFLFRYCWPCLGNVPRNSVSQEPHALKRGNRPQGICGNQPNF